MQTNPTNEFHEDPSEEPIGESLLKPIGWIAALAIVFVTAGAQALARIDDHSDDWATSAELKEAQARDARDHRRQLAAQALCHHEHGHQALAVWIDADTIECVNKRGKRLSTENAGGAL